MPGNTSLLADRSHAVGLLGRCDASNPLQRWQFRMPDSAPPLDKLWLATCNASDAAQKLGFVGGELKSGLTGKCLDKARLAEAACTLKHRNRAHS